MATDGCVVVENVLDRDYIERARAALLHAIEVEAAYHGSTDYPDYGMVLVFPMYGRDLLELFDNPRVIEPFEYVLGAGCITYACTSSSMPPYRSNRSARIHVDCPRIIPNYVTNMAATILLDDFTEENGATWYLPGSHRRADAPSEDEFFSQARRLVAPAGSALFFNARVWHSGADNTTANWRHALTLNMCRPWMKQRLDIPRMLEFIGHGDVSPRILQKLGFDSRIPASLDEYYAPPDRRLFRQQME